MDATQMNEVIAQVSLVYKRRGYVTIGDVQAKLEEFDATLVETSRVMWRLEEVGCKITDGPASSDDFEFFACPDDQGELSLFDKFHNFFVKEKIESIPGIDFALAEYETGLLYYMYLRLIMKLSRETTKKHIDYLQKSYNLFLSEGEDKVIFDVKSAEFAQEICMELQSRKVTRQQKSEHKKNLNAIINYQHFLSQNEHHIIAKCESLI